MKKTVASLGATGSVGSQAIDVVRSRGYKVDFLSAARDVERMESLARELTPAAVAMADERAAADLKARLADTDISVLSGEAGICDGIGECSADTVVNAILGEAGLLPTLATLKSGKRLALANKESLVIAGDIVMKAAKDAGAEIIPVDSEHSAIFQSLKSGTHGEVKRIILTASGGPFFGKRRDELSAVTLADALNHPTWKMGKKITVDSATLMNKGFEVIEAVHLFGVPADSVEVVVHRESILHSAVEYIDNAVIGEFSVPDMRACVQYALDYPRRTEAVIAPLDLVGLGRLSFFAPDVEAFPLLMLAKRAISDGGAMPAVLNAANEVAVAAFLAERLSFVGIDRVVRATYDKMYKASSVTDLEGIILADREARVLAESFI